MGKTDKVKQVKRVCRTFILKVCANELCHCGQF
jgi:hypothetical protein